MRGCFQIALWLIAWPVILPVWLWRKGTVGKGLAALFGLLFVLAVALTPGANPDKEGVSTSSTAPPRVPTFTPTPLAISTVAPAENAATVTPMTIPTDTPAPAAPLPTDTPVPTNPPADTPTPALVGATANSQANLRSGPGTDYAVASSVAAGAALTLVARNQASDWYQLADGTWIAAFLVDNPPDVGVAAVIPPSPVQAVVEATPVQAVVEATPTSAPDVVQPTVASNPQAFNCAGGCATPPDASCAIKGNVNSAGERIYHVPGGQFYSRTDIKPEEGDRWFCTSAEAQSAGFRASER